MQILTPIYGTLIIVAIFLAGAQATAHETKHNMVLYGEKEIYASHIVYKEPHNFQLILKVKLPRNLVRKIRALRAIHASKLVILYLDHFEITKVKELTTIKGAVQIKDEDLNVEQTLASVTLGKQDFEVIYSQLIPTSLTNSKVSH